jgi:prephenate dehydrogenase
MHCLVVGAGAMGRWFADTVDAEVTFVDVDPEAAADAAAAAGTRAVPHDDPVAADLVCVAVPMPQAADAVAEYAPQARRGMVDVTGSMTDPVDAMREHVPDGERCSLHPLFAPERGPERVAVVQDAPGPLTDEVLAQLEVAGNTLVRTTPEEHDDAMTSVQAAAHAAVLAYALVADDVRPEFHTPVSEGLAGVVDLVTGNEPRVYADVRETFDGAEEVAKAAAALSAADQERFEELYELASRKWATQDETGGQQR